jgi:3-phenylpropionate/trans-cinnamate dioxygenase ferredoxin subunit
MEKRIRIGPASEIPEGECRVFQLDAIDIVICRIDGRFFAVSNNCPHAGIVISRGPLTGTVLTCPGHGLRFDVTTGACLDRDDLVLGRFAVEEDDGILYVRF